MHLYLLPFRDGKRFKIGIAANVNSRLDSLGRGKFNLSKARAFKSSAKVIKSLERQLHTDFFLFREDGSDLRTGYTEVFNTACWDDVCDEIEYKKKKLAHLNIEENKKAFVPKQCSKRAKKKKPLELKKVWDIESDKPEELTTREHKQRAQAGDKFVEGLEDFLVALDKNTEAIRIIRDNDENFLGLIATPAKSIDLQSIDPLKVGVKFDLRMIDNFWVTSILLDLFRVPCNLGDNVGLNFYTDEEIQKREDNHRRRLKFVEAQILEKCRDKASIIINSNILVDKLQDVERKMDEEVERMAAECRARMRARYPD